MSQKSNITKQKATGSHFTPPRLARLVAKRLLDNLPQENEGEILVLDPACGDGELLLQFIECCSFDLRKRICLVGVEQDEQSLQEAEARFAEMPSVEFRPLSGDFLQFVENRMKNRRFFNSFPVPSELEKDADVIIANPPYVRTQILGAERSQELAKTFGLSGRVDLYHAFMVAMTHQLAPDGLFGVITSNRFLTTKGGASIRKFLAKTYDIIEILDLGDTKLFEAAVLPSVFFGKKKSGLINTHSISTEPAFVRIYELLEEHSKAEGQPVLVDSIYSILEKPSSGQFQTNGKIFEVAVGILTIPDKPSDPWMMVTPEEKAWLKRIQSNATYTISDLAKVRVGIKTTADSVFIRDNWKDLPENIQPEDSLLLPLISRQHLNRWLPNEEAVNTKVLYTHKVHKGQRVVIDMTHYPKAMAYLEKHRERLEGRKYVIESGRKWYEIWVPQDPSAWDQHKLVFPDISPEPKFAFDAEGFVVNGNCYWITIDDDPDDDLLHLIQGVANSSLMAKYHDLASNNKLYSGRRRYITQYVEKYPIPDPNSQTSKEIIALVREAIYGDPTQRRLHEIENEIEHLVSVAFGVSAAKSEGVQFQWGFATA